MSTYEISKSSLLSLKAEIIRKQQELSKTKVENEVKIKALKKNKLDIKNKGIESRERNDQNDDNEDLLKQSRSVLEHKAKLYEKLSSGKQSKEEQQRNKHYLVRFDKKYVGDLPPDDCDFDERHSESDDNFYQSDEENDKDSSEKWVDYVDCLGRTRRCMQKDLEYLKSKDEELGKIVEEKKNIKNLETKSQETDLDQIDSFPKEQIKSREANSASNEPSELFSCDMRREALRQQWEKEEEELCNKSDIHYQDLLFGEARSHGVGYYGFSKDEEERTKQQEALRKLREETEIKQRKAQELRNSREKMLAARLKAARNRKRARMGLPPEEDEPEPISAVLIPEDTEKQDKQKEIDENERLLLEARKNHIRPWDVGKEGVKEHVVMTQEEWVQQKRKERPKEFAPPTNNRKDFRANLNEKEREDNEINKSLKFTTKRTFKNKNKFETKRKNELNSKTLMNFEEVEQSPTIQATPIEELNITVDFDDTLLENYKRVMNKSNSNCEINRGKGVEIAPPPSYDYYGPASISKIRKNDIKHTNIQDSIEAGLKFLREQVEEKEKSTKHPDDMFLF